MANNYRYVQRYRPSGRSRSEGAAKFCSIFLEFVGCNALYSAADVPLDPSPMAISRLLDEVAAASRFPELGFDIDLFVQTPAPERAIRLEFHLGTQPGEAVVDFMAASLGPAVPAVDRYTVLRLLGVDSESPLEAFLAENNNEYELHARKRQAAIRSHCRPALIRGLHFIGAAQVATLGGLAKCRSIPAASADEVLGGLLLSLVDGPFDPANPEHLVRQSEATRVADGLG